MAGEGDGVEIPYDRLNELNGALKQIIVEFENAKDNSSALEEAIGRPHGESGLRDQADRFEGEWDDKRNQLKEDLLNIQEHVEAVVKNWSDWDSEASTELDLALTQEPAAPDTSGA